MRRAERPLREQLVSPWPWHRWLGVGAALLLVWAGVTGMLLVHAEDLGLRQRPVTSGWVLDLFGVPEPALELGHPTPLGWVASTGDRVFLGPQPLPTLLGDLAGVMTGPAGTVVAGSDALLLFDAAGALLEVLPPGSDPALGALVPVPPEPLPQAARAALAQAARSAALDWEQVLRVLHGSHGVGWFGKLVADLTALALIVLSLTGVAMFVQRRRHQRHGRRDERG